MAHNNDLKMTRAEQVNRRLQRQAKKTESQMQECITGIVESTLLAANSDRVIKDICPNVLHVHTLTLPEVKRVLKGYLLVMDVIEEKRTVGGNS